MVRYPDKLNGRTCLVIDDEADVADVLVHHLNHRGFSTTVAGDVEAGRRRLGEQAWELVIVDVILPGGDGRDLIPEVRRLDPQPVVILTSVLTRDDLDLEYSDSYLYKPFRRSDVDDVLAHAGFAGAGGV